jgi:hypothetical protein
VEHALKRLEKLQKTYDDELQTLAKLQQQLKAIEEEK